MVERLAVNELVVGSNPTPGAKKLDNADKTMCVQSGEPMVLKLGQRGY